MSALVRWSDRMWITWPRRALLRRPSLAGLVGDGHVVTTVPVLGVLLPLAALLGGLLTGLLRIGFTDVLTESVLLLSVLLALGCFSTQLGALGLTGFVVGDLVSTRPATGTEAGLASGDGWFAGPLGSGLLGHLLHVRLPHVVYYLLLAAVVVVLPRAVRGVVGAVGRRRAQPPLLAWLLVSGLVTVITWLGVSAWVDAAPTLVRPVFTWSASGAQPTVQAVAPLQDRGTVVVGAALLATLLRQCWLGLALLPGTVQDRLRAAEATPPPVGGPAAPRRERPLPSALLAASVATLALAGLLESLLMAGVAFAVFFVVRLLRSDQLRVPALDAWRELTDRAPAWARLLGLWLLSRVASDAVGNELIGSYTALAVVVLVSVVVVLVLFPGPPRATARQDVREPAA